MYVYNDIRVFDDSYGFLKGNLHGHTVVSDGKLTYEETIKRYKAAGYGFISITDHEIYTDVSHMGDESFVVLPGVEWACTRFEKGRLRTLQHHVNGIKGIGKPQTIKHLEELPGLEYRGIQTIYEMRDYLTERGNFCIYNHPRWSQVMPEEIGNLEGFAAIDIFNYNVTEYNHQGEATLFWDLLLRNGMKINGVAVDDNYNGKTISDRKKRGTKLCAILSHEEKLHA